MSSILSTVHAGKDKQTAPALSFGRPRLSVENMDENACWYVDQVGLEVFPLPEIEYIHVGNQYRKKVVIALETDEAIGNRLENQGAIRLPKIGPQAFLGMTFACSLDFPIRHAHDASVLKDFADLGGIAPV